MRPVQLADIETVARVLSPLQPNHRSVVMARLWADADVADRYRKVMGRAHPQFGNGTLMSAATPFEAGPRPAVCCADYLNCLQIVIEYLLEKSIHHNA